MAEDSIAKAGALRTGPMAVPYQLKLILKSMRPRQWTKNGIVFMALIFSVNQEWKPEDVSTWDHLVLQAFLTAVAFSLVSGAGYLINDTRDRESDRMHPRKSRRPIAAGLLSPQVAVLAAAVCIAAGTITAFVTSLRSTAPSASPASASEYRPPIISFHGIRLPWRAARCTPR